MLTCVICGQDIYTPDYYGQIRRKYCPSCAAAMKREQKRAWQAEYRARQREINANARQLCELQRQQIEKMRDEIIRLRSVIENGRKNV